jgi:hypothetical protein
MPRFRTRLSIATLVIAVGACNPAAASVPSPSPSTERRPSLTLEIVGGAAAGTYASSEAASLNLCTRLDDGGWRTMYAGGEPWISLDMHVGSGIGATGSGSDLALEVDTRVDYFWIDQGGLRGGDEPGRSRVAATMQTAADAVTFVVDATTPKRTPSGDGVTAELRLTWICPT